MSDYTELVARLRNHLLHGENDSDQQYEAANAIEQLVAERDKAEAILKKIRFILED